MFFFLLQRLRIAPGRRAGERESRGVGVQAEGGLERRRPLRQEPAAARRAGGTRRSRLPAPREPAQSQPRRRVGSDGVLPGQLPAARDRAAHARAWLPAQGQRPRGKRHLDGPARLVEAYREAGVQLQGRSASPRLPGQVEIAQYLCIILKHHGHMVLLRQHARLLEAIYIIPALRMEKTSVTSGVPSAKRTWDLVMPGLRRDTISWVTTSLLDVDLVNRRCPWECRSRLAGVKNQSNNGTDNALFFFFFFFFFLYA